MSVPSTSGISRDGGESGSEGRSLPSSMGTPQRVQQGSCNSNFKRFGDNVTKDVIATTVGTFAGATVGRIPIVGVPLTMATRQLVREQLADVRLFTSADGDPNNSGQVIWSTVMYLFISCNVVCIDVERITTLFYH